MSRLLLVDDEPAVIASTKRQLHFQKLDYEIEGVTSGKAALRLLRDVDIDTIILDIRMLEMSGIELLSILKSDPATAHIPVIMLTGCAERDLKRKALELGAYDFVNKPADRYELAARVKSALRIKSYEDKLRLQNSSLEEQLIQMQKMELAGILSSGIAHDLNNILTSITGKAELAYYVGESSQVVRNHLSEVLKSCGYATQLVRQFYRFGAKNKATHEIRDLRDLIDKSLQLLSALLLNDVVVNWNRPNETAAVGLDSTQIYQVLMNLCINAVQAMEGSGTLTISLERVGSTEVPGLQLAPSSPGVYFRVGVADTGPGIDEATLEHIFESFFTTKPEGVGTGIGLSVVRLLMERMGGAVSVISKLGQGTTFFIYVPAVLTPDIAVSPSLEGVVHGR